jgi:hypothetical protein
MFYNSNKERVLKAKALIENGVAPMVASETTGVYPATARYMRDVFHKKSRYIPMPIYPARVLH